MKLSVVAPRIRKLILAVIAFMIVYTIFSTAVYPVVKKAFIAAFPPKDAPTVLYGLLDPLEFVDKPLVSAPASYVLNTKNGELPSLPKKAPVYKFIQPRFSYNDGSAAQKNASLLGFSNEDLITDLKGDLYKWEKKSANSSLSIYIRSKELNLSTPLSSGAALYKVGLVSSTSSKAAAGVLSALGRYDDLYREGSSTVALGKYMGTTLYKATNTSEAQVAKVDFFRKINKVSIVSQDFSQGLLQVYVATTPGDKSTTVFPIINAYHWEIDRNADATYPLVSVADAWKEVQNGGGIISSVVPSDANPFAGYTPVKVDKVYINNIYVAYYDTEKLQKYLQPIYVFEGNYTASGSAKGKGTIAIYYPAVSGQWTKPITPTNNSVTPK